MDWLVFPKLSRKVVTFITVAMLILWAFIWLVT